MPDPIEDHCERCGHFGPGVRRWMFYHVLSRFPQPPVAREFFCFRCIRIMRVYAIIGLALLAIVIGALVIGVIRATSAIPTP